MNSFPLSNAPSFGFDLAQQQFLSLRLSSAEASLMQALHQSTGLSKTEIVKEALRAFAKTKQTEMPSAMSLFDLGANSFGKYGDASRQSKNMKRIVRERLNARKTNAMR